MSATKSLSTLFHWKPGIWVLSLWAGCVGTGCRVVSSYQAAPPILATPSDSSRGEVCAALPSLQQLPTAYWYGATTQGLQAWYRPARGFLLTGEGLYWHDVSKFERQDGFLNNRLPLDRYSGLTNGFSASAGMGTYGRLGTLHWVALGGIAWEQAWVRHLILFTQNGSQETYKEVRTNRWAKPHAQIHLYRPLLQRAVHASTHLFLAIGYRSSFLMDAGVRRTLYVTSSDLDALRQDKALRPVFGQPKSLTIFHQPFLGFKAEYKHLSGLLRLSFVLGGNKGYLHPNQYSIESVLGLRF